MGLAAWIEARWSAFRAWRLTRPLRCPTCHEVIDRDRASRYAFALYCSEECLVEGQRDAAW